MPPSLTSPFFSALRYSPLLANAALPLRSLFTSSPPPTSPTVQRYLLRQPWSGASRECPTPIILVRAIGLSSAYPSLASSGSGSSPNAEEDGHWEDWGAMFSEKGYTALEVDIAAPSTLTPPSPSASADGAADRTVTQPPPSPLKAMSSLLASQIRLLAIPFPPILVSSEDSCLLTQMYIEDNPASGLVLLDPPSDDAGGSGSASKAAGGNADAWQLPKFGYEPRFPILLMASTDRMGEVEQSRLGKAAANGRSRGGKGVTLERVVDGHRGEKSRIVVERWMDSCGF
ncbi:uncharacterized protein MKK02DRAFT_43029 [Dioszegia hungarica]|uniref:Uncharacterized protein n=1 Tax=Dioszegia hungarica TaxID=4972 RepID=A0AA38HE87_9TREE|nr:uncharacterized protein MKK02DRAFT_43029 [Dioszegia hungarica]KAI9638630.1 hypothetical protein MKK02DRAFT_43029 [Dioszegia hungarica]